MASIRGVEIDVEVVHRLMNGDSRAQAEVFEALATPVYTMAVRVLGDTHAAEDVTQDTFVDVLTKAHTIRKPAQFVGWVRTIAVNRCFMRLRSPWHRNRTNYEPYEQGYETNISQEIDIESALAQMDKRSRLVVWLYCVEGYTHKEIGQLLKKSTSYSKAIISRLTKKFTHQTSNVNVQEEEESMQETRAVMHTRSALSCL